ncbi:hypothetical protein LTR66_016228, partial [Elasticomyces elasticus]
MQAVKMQSMSEVFERADATPIHKRPYLRTSSGLHPDTLDIEGRRAVMLDSSRNVFGAETKYYSVAHDRSKPFRFDGNTQHDQGRTRLLDAYDAAVDTEDDTLQDLILPLHVAKHPLDSFDAQWQPWPPEESYISVREDTPSEDEGPMIRRN